jgi:hypothetical protein
MAVQNNMQKKKEKGKQAVRKRAWSFYGVLDQEFNTLIEIPSRLFISSNS